MSNAPKPGDVGYLRYRAEHPDEGDRMKRKKRAPWGHVSRHCVRCFKVGPRTRVIGGWAHKYCLTKKSKTPSLREREERANLMDCE